MKELKINEIKNLCLNKIGNRVIFVAFALFIFPLLICCNSLKTNHDQSIEYILGNNTLPAIFDCNFKKVRNIHNIKLDDKNLMFNGLCDILKSYKQQWNIEKDDTLPEIGKDEIVLVRLGNPISDTSKHDLILIFTFDKSKSKKLLRFEYYFDLKEQYIEGLLEELDQISD